MTIYYHATGEQRKALAKKVSEIIGAPAEYQYMPSCAYTIADFYTVTREGNLEICDRADSEEVENLIDSLEKAGFEFEPQGENEDTLTISMPKSYFTYEALENLKKLIENKSLLIKHALDASFLDILETDDTIDFPWFTVEQDEDAESYTQFISKLCEFAKKQTRINNKLDKSTNEKYAFRCFLIRIGMVGNEYKAARKVLLRKLSGSSAFRDGRPNGGNDNAVSE